MERDANQGLVIAYKFAAAAAYDFSSCSSWMSWLILHDIARWQEKMTALQEERKEKLGDMSDILEKRDSIGKQIQATCNENPGGLFGRIPKLVHKAWKSYQVAVKDSVRASTKPIKKSQTRLHLVPNCRVRKRSRSAMSSARNSVKRSASTTHTRHF